MSGSQLFLIDGHALLYRSYYALPELTNSRGQPTNAIYGFLKTLRKIIRHYEPGYLAVCFDTRAKTHREEKFEAYKIQRPQMPDNLVSQIPIVKDVIKAFNFSIFECDGYEADDIIATISKKFKVNDIEIIIVSDDKDMFQLANERVMIYSARKDKMLKSGDVKESLGVEPCFVPDFIGLAGDSVDNIPGVKGIGPATAKDLIGRYGDLDKIFKHVEELSSQSIRNRLNVHKDMAFLSKELASLDNHVPIDCNLKELAVGEPNKEKLYKIFNELEFHKEAQEFSIDVVDQESLNENCILSPAQVKILLTKISKKGQFAFLLDASQSSEDIFASQKLYLSLGGDEVYCLDSEHLPALRDVFGDESIRKITFDLKENLRLLKRHDIKTCGAVFDCLLAGYLLFPGRSKSDISSLSWDYLKKSLPEDQRRMLFAAKAIFDLQPFLLKELREKDLLPLFERIELPLVYVLFTMEEEGVKIDQALLKKLSEDSQKKIESLVKEIYRLAGQEFNLNSPKQLGHVLFDQLKLPVLKKTKTGYSTNEEVLNRLVDQHPIPALLLEYRQLSKLKSTYIDALPRLVDPDTQRIHASFNQVGAETGRLSSNHPNLQNIPIRTDLGRQIRRAFIPTDKSRCIIAADYSQIELRILAHLSNDSNLKQAFQQDQDIHAFTAAQVFDVKESDVNYEMRDTAKRVNFGIIYGMSAFGLAKDLKIPQQEAQAFIDTYFTRYPGVKKFMDDTIKKCEKEGYVVTLLNRRRYITEINNSNLGIRQFAQRQAINTPVQGTAADLIKLAMIRIQDEIDRHNLQSKMIITVHDELVFDAVIKEEEILIQLVRDRMEDTLTLSVPIKVTIKHGKNWLDTKEYKP